MPCLLVPSLHARCLASHQVNRELVGEGHRPRSVQSVSKFIFQFILGGDAKFTHEEQLLIAEMRAEGVSWGQLSLEYDRYRGEVRARRILIVSRSQPRDPVLGLTMCLLIPRLTHLLGSRRTRVLAADPKEDARA